MWAWAGWRVKKMRRFVDHVLCKLPFEEAWYRERGCNATYVGHPYFDELRGEPLDAAFIERKQRTARAAGDDPARLADAGSAQQLSLVPQGGCSSCTSACPNARFAVAAFKPRQAEMVRAAIARRATCRSRCMSAARPS